MARIVFDTSAYTGSRLRLFDRGYGYSDQNKTLTVKRLNVFGPKRNILQETGALRQKNFATSFELQEMRGYEKSRIFK